MGEPLSLRIVPENSSVARLLNPSVIFDISGCHAATLLDEKEIGFLQSAQLLFPGVILSGSMKSNSGLTCSLTA